MAVKAFSTLSRVAKLSQHRASIAQKGTGLRVAGAQKAFCGKSSGFLCDLKQKASDKSQLCSENVENRLALSTDAERFRLSVGCLILLKVTVAKSMGFGPYLE